jgi:hypothetical protein
MLTEEEIEAAADKFFSTSLKSVIKDIKKRKAKVIIIGQKCSKCNEVVIYIAPNPARRNNEELRLIKTDPGWHARFYKNGPPVNNQQPPECPICGHKPFFIRLSDKHIDALAGEVLFDSDPNRWEIPNIKIVPRYS